MEKNTYKEELSRITLLLMQEKEKVKTLQEQISHIPKGRANPYTTTIPTSSSISAEQIKKFKQLVLSFKKIYQSKQHELKEESERIQVELKQLHQNSEKTNNDYEELSNKYRSEIEQYEKSIQTLEQDKGNLQAAITESRQHAEQLERVNQFLRDRSEEAHLDANQLEQEFQGSRDTIEKVTTEAKKWKEKYEELANSQSDEVRVLLNQIGELRAELGKKPAPIPQALPQNNIQHLEHEIADIKQILIRGLREAKELERRYRESVQEKAALIHKLQHQQKEITSLEMKFREEFSKAVEEKEQQLYAAQQHLGKKVREVAHYTEKVEELEGRIASFANSQMELKSKNHELQTLIEKRSQEEKVWSEQLEAKTRKAEQDSKIWEDKYSHLNEKHQHLESRLSELEKLEEKHRQLQSLLSNLGTVIGAPVGITQPTAILPKQHKATPSAKEVPQFGTLFEEELQEKPDTSSKPYQNIFDMPKPSQRPKQNLFE